MAGVAGWEDMLLSSLALASPCQASTAIWVSHGLKSTQGPCEQSFPQDRPSPGLGVLNLTRGPWVALSREPVLLPAIQESLG